MLIDNPEAFNTWLTAVLEPLCDADPAALAKYIYALVKKDKPLDDLRSGMLDQLDVFLQKETEPFVELLFRSLETREYLKPVGSETRNERRSTSPILAEDSCSRITNEARERDDSLQIPPKQSHSDVRNDKPEISKKDSTNAKEKDSDRGKYNDVSKKDIAGKNQRIVLNRTTKFTPATVPKEKPSYVTEQTLVKVIPDLLEDSLNEQLPVRNSRRDRKFTDKEDRKRRKSYRSRSRSRSWERNRCPPSGGRSLWRNRSPPSNRYERRRSRSGSPPIRIPRYRNRSPPTCIESDIQPSRSRSRSRERPISPIPNPRDRLDGISNERDRDRQSRNRDKIDRDRDRIDRDRERDDRRIRDPVSGTATPTQDSNPGDSGNQPRGTTTLAGIFAPTQKKRCRDFDEKGFCMRGDLCQFDHGSDPVVLEDSTLSHVLAHPMARPPPRLPAPGCIPEYNPLAPDIWRGVYPAPPPAYFPYMGPPHGHHPVQRELIPIPTVRTENILPNNTTVPPPINATLKGSLSTVSPLAPITPANNQVTSTVITHSGKKKPFDFNRGGSNRHHINKQPGGNCSLELKKVPSGLNDITHLNNHFTKFGKIVNIQVCYEDDPEAALITFSSHTEANVAYKSTEAVLNNRFIKVFWHNSEQSKQENVPPGQRIAAKERLTSNHSHINNNNVNHVSHNKVLINKDPNKQINNFAENKTVVSKEETDVTVETNKNNEEISSVMKEIPVTTDTPKAEIPPTTELVLMVKKRNENAAKIVKDLRRRSQQLLDKQLQYQKHLLERLDSSNITAAQKESLIKTIKSVQENIERTRKELVATPKVSNQQLKKAGFGHLKKTRTKEETQKEILDAELDLITKQQEGQDVSELQKRVAELRRQQQFALKPSLPSRRVAINKLAVRSRFAKSTTGGKALFVNQSVDHRPRSFLVSGYEADELDQLMQHFTQFGEIVDSVVDPTIPSLWLQFKSRKVAEQAATKGRQFSDRTLTVTWQQKAMPSTPQPQVEKSTNLDNTNSMEDDVIFNPSSPTFPSFETDSWSQKDKGLNSPSYHPVDAATNEELLLTSPKTEWDYTHVTSPSFNFPDSEDDEGKDDEKEEDRSWRR